jgi:glycosyltransferase involved in cell wall biosynthesis
MGRLHHRIGQHLRYRRAARQRARSNEWAMPRIHEQLRTWKVDMVHLNSAAVGIAPLLLDDGSLPVVWHIREMPEGHYRLHFDAGRRAYGAALRKARKLIAMSYAIRDDIQRYAGTHAPVATIYDGVFPAAAYAPLGAHAAQRWDHVVPFRFVFAGLIHPSKKQEEAIEALALVRARGRNARLVIAGGGRDGRLRELIARLALNDHVELTGFVPDVMALLERAHCLLMCSRNEAFGRVTVEAMASGLPVIGHASGGTPELIEDGRSGLLYPGGAEALAERMLQVIDDPGKARAMGDHAMRLAPGRFNIERMTDEVMAVYREVIPVV